MDVVEWSKSGIVKIKDIAFECRKGLLRPSYVVDIIKEKRTNLSEKMVMKYVNMLMDSLPTEYSDIIEENENPSKSIPPLSITFRTDNTISLLPRNTKAYYDVLILKLSKNCEPRSLSKWEQRYNELDVNKVYTILNLSFLQSDVRELAFKLFHNVIFTKERLMKCKITVDDVCPVCLLSTEDVYHMMFECSHLADFNDFMKNVLLNMFVQKIHLV